MSSYGALGHLTFRSSWIIVWNQKNKIGSRKKSVYLCDINLNVMCIMSFSKHSMASMCLVVVPTLPGHAPDEQTDGLLEQAS